MRLATKGFRDSQEPENDVRPEKVISETALLLYAASTVVGVAEIGQAVKALAERLSPYSTGPRIRLGICLHPALALEFGQAHILLRRIGHGCPELDALIGEALSSQAREGRERPPHRVLEQEWCTALWAGAETGQCRAETLRASALATPLDLLGGSRDDLYAFTHAVMYASGFNLHRSRLPRSGAILCQEAESMLARCVDEEDYDLAGEVLLTWPLTRTRWSATATFAFRLLAQIEDEAGFLTSGGTRLDRLKKLKGKRRSEYLLATAYHTAYVMGVLCAATLQAGRLPPARLHAFDAQAPLLLPEPDSRDRPRHWECAFQELNPAEQAALRQLCFDAGLYRTARARDFGTLMATLTDGHAHGLTGSPMASQSAELLARVGLVGGAT